MTSTTDRPVKKITLAGVEYAIQPLKLRHIRELGIIAAKVTAAPTEPAEREAFFYDQMIDTIAAGLSDGNPEMDHEAILELRTTLPEILAASGAILKLSGLVTTGEAEAAA